MVDTQLNLTGKSAVELSIEQLQHDRMLAYDKLTMDLRKSNTNDKRQILISNYRHNIMIIDDKLRKLCSNKVLREM